MAVVINEFETSPAPAEKKEAAGQQGQGGPATLTPTLLHDIEKAMHRKHQRIERLAEY
jgi:hypothetical protein